MAEEIRLSFQTGGRPKFPFKDWPIRKLRAPFLSLCVVFPTPWKPRAVRTYRLFPPVRTIGDGWRLVRRWYAVVVLADADAVCRAGKGLLLATCFWWTVWGDKRKKWHTLLPFFALAFF